MNSRLPPRTMVLVTLGRGMLGPVSDAIERRVQVLVIGGGQAGLSVGFHLRRAGFAPRRDVVILDASSRPGGAWTHGWDSLRLFSPSTFSSLPGWPMPAWTEGFPPAGHVVDYLREYERRYDLPVERPVEVTAVRHSKDGPSRFLVETDRGVWHADAVVSATGTWWRPFWPTYPGMRAFWGRQIHTVDYRRPDEFAGQHVVVVGGGNSAAQILAEVATVATTTWVTLRPPRFLPDDVDGRVLFDLATARSAALREGLDDPGGVAGVGDIVMVPPVRAARDRGVLVARPPFEHLDRHGMVWADGRREDADAVIWCTGFRPALNHLFPLGLTLVGGHPATDGTRSIDDPMVHLVGYGDWTGPATATLIGVGRSARSAVEELRSQLPTT